MNNVNAYVGRLREVERSLIERVHFTYPFFIMNNRQQSFHSAAHPSNLSIHVYYDFLLNIDTVNTNQELDSSKQTLGRGVVCHFFYQAMVGHLIVSHKPDPFRSDCFQ